MNCCDANGNCNQGRDCPVRAERAEQPLTRGESLYIYTIVALGAMAYAAVIVMVLT